MEIQERARRDCDFEPSAQTARSRPVAPPAPATDARLSHCRRESCGQSVLRDGNKFSICDSSGKMRVRGGIKVDKGKKANALGAAGIYGVNPPISFQ